MGLLRYFGASNYLQNRILTSYYTSVIWPQMVYSIWYCQNVPQPFLNLGGQNPIYGRNRCCDVRLSVSVHVNSRRECLISYEFDSSIKQRSRQRIGHSCWYLLPRDPNCKRKVFTLLYGKIWCPDFVQTSYISIFKAALHHVPSGNHLSKGNFFINFHSHKM